MQDVAEGCAQVFHALDYVSLVDIVLRWLYTTRSKVYWGRGEDVPVVYYYQPVCEFHSPNIIINLIKTL